MDADLRDRPPPSLTRVFLAFLHVGLTSVGGATAAWMHREVVQRHRWLTEEQFLTSLTVAQVLPGANPVNMAVYLGLQLHGGLGALLAAAGMVFPSFCIILVLGVLYSMVSGMPLTPMLLGGLAMVGVAATLVMGLKSARKLPRTGATLAIATATFVAVGLLRWPLVPVLLGLVPLSVLLALSEERRQRRG